jgi:hypothetical protein
MDSSPVMSMLILNRLSTRLGKQNPAFHFVPGLKDFFPGLKEGISNGT